MSESSVNSTIIQIYRAQAPTTSPRVKFFQSVTLQLSETSLASAIEPVAREVELLRNKEQIIIAHGGERDRALDAREMLFSDTARTVH